MGANIATMDDARDRQRERLQQLEISVQQWKATGRWSGPKLLYDDVAMMLSVIKQLDEAMLFATMDFAKLRSGLP